MSQPPTAAAEHAREQSRQKLRSRAKAEDVANAKRLLEGTLASGLDQTVNLNQTVTSLASSHSRSRLADFMDARPAPSIPVPEDEAPPAVALPELDPAPAENAGEPKVRRLAAKEAAERALTKVQLVIQFMNLQRYDDSLVDVRAKSKAIPPTLDLREELQKRYVPPDIKPSQYFTSAFSQIHHLIETFTDDEITDASLDEEEQQVLRDLATALKRKKMTMSSCSCRQGLDQLIANAEKVASTKAREDSTKAFTKIISGSVTMIRAMELNLEDRDKQIRELTIANASLTKEVAALKEKLDSAMLSSGGLPSGGVTAQDVALLTQAQFLDREVRLFNALKRLNAGGVKMSVPMAMQREFGKDADANAPWVEKFLKRTKLIQDLRRKVAAVERHAMAAHDQAAKYPPVSREMQTLKDEDIVGTKAWERKQGAMKAAARTAHSATLELSQAVELVVPTLFDAAAEVRLLAAAGDDFPSRVSDALTSVLMSTKEFMSQIDQCRVESIASVVEMLEPRVQQRAIMSLNLWQVQLDSGLRDAMDAFRPGLKQLATAVREVVGNTRREASRAAQTAAALRPPTPAVTGEKDQPGSKSASRPVTRELPAQPPQTPMATVPSSPKGDETRPSTPPPAPPSRAAASRDAKRTSIESPTKTQSKAKANSSPTATEAPKSAGAAVVTAPAAVKPAAKKKSLSVKDVPGPGLSTASKSTVSPAKKPSKKLSSSAKSAVTLSAPARAPAGPAVALPPPPTADTVGEDYDVVESDGAEDDEGDDAVSVAAVEMVDASCGTEPRKIVTTATSAVDGPFEDDDERFLTIPQGEALGLVEVATSILDSTKAALVDVRNRLGVLLPRDVLSELASWDGGKSFKTIATAPRQRCEHASPHVSLANAQLAKCQGWIEAVANGLALIDPPPVPPVMMDEGVSLSDSFRRAFLRSANAGTTPPPPPSSDPQPPLEGNCCAACKRPLGVGYETIDAALPEGDPDPFDRPKTDSTSLPSAASSRRPEPLRAAMIAAMADSLADAAASTPRAASKSPGLKSKAHPTAILMANSVAALRSAAVLLLSRVADARKGAREVGSVSFSVVDDIAAVKPIVEGAPLQELAECVSQVSAWLSTVSDTFTVTELGSKLIRSAEQPALDASSSVVIPQMSASVKPASRELSLRSERSVGVSQQQTSSQFAQIVHRFAHVALEALHIDAGCVGEPARSLLIGHEAALTLAASEVLMATLVDVVTNKTMLAETEASLAMSNRSAATDGAVRALQARVRHLENMVSAGEATAADLVMERNELEAEKHQIEEELERVRAANRTHDALSLVASHIKRPEDALRRPTMKPPMDEGHDVAAHAASPIIPVSMQQSVRAERPPTRDIQVVLSEDTPPALDASYASFKLSAGPSFTVLTKVDAATSRRTTPDTPAPPPPVTQGTHIELFPRPTVSRGSIGQWTGSKPPTPESLPRRAQDSPPRHAATSHRAALPSLPNASSELIVRKAAAEAAEVPSPKPLSKPPKPVPKEKPAAPAAPMPPALKVEVHELTSYVSRDIIELIHNLTAAERIVAIHSLVGSDVLQLHDAIFSAVRLAAKRLKIPALSAAADPLDMVDAAVRNGGAAVDLSEVMEHDRLVLMSLADLLREDSHAAVAKMQRTFERVKCRIMRRQVDAALHRTTEKARVSTAPSGYQWKRETEFLLRQQKRLEEHAAWLEEQKNHIAQEQARRRLEWTPWGRPSSRDAPLFTTHKVLLRTRDGAPRPVTESFHRLITPFPEASVAQDPYSILFQEKVKRWLAAKKSLFERRRRLVGPPPSVGRAQRAVGSIIPTTAAVPDAHEATALMRQVMDTPGLQRRRPSLLDALEAAPHASTPPPSAKPAIHQLVGEAKTETPPPRGARAALGPLKKAAPPATPATFVEMSQQNFKNLTRGTKYV